MAELLYHRIHIEPYSEKETVPVQYVGVYVTRWHDHPEQPTEAFYEAEEEQERVEKLEEEHKLMLEALRYLVGPNSVRVMHTSKARNALQAVTGVSHGPTMNAYGDIIEE